MIATKLISIEISWVLKNTDNYDDSLHIIFIKISVGIWSYKNCLMLVCKFAVDALIAIQNHILFPMINTFYYQILLNNYFVFYSFIQVDPKS